MKFFVKIFLTFLVTFNLMPVYAQDINNSSNINKTIAILDFENNTGLMSQEGLKKGLSDSLTNNLSRYVKLNILERSRLKDALTEISLNQSGFVSTDSAAKIGKIAGSQYVILGSVSKLGDIFEVSVRIVDVQSSKVNFGRSVRCLNEEAIFKGLDYLALETANNLGENIDSRVMDTARKDAENFVKEGNNNWLLWVGGGVLVAVIVTVVAIAISKSSPEKVQNICIGPRCTTVTTPKRNDFDSLEYQF